jgi:hypothetical protein
MPTHIKHRTAAPIAVNLLIFPMLTTYTRRGGPFFGRYQKASLTRQLSLKSTFPESKIDFPNPSADANWEKDDPDCTEIDDH